MNKSKSFTKTFSQLFLFLLFFHLLFSSYVHVPCAHYRERKRQVCIILICCCWCCSFGFCYFAQTGKKKNLSHFRHLSPFLFFSAYIHAPSAHHKERNRQVCIRIIINKFVFDFTCMFYHSAFSPFFFFGEDSPPPSPPPRLVYSYT